MVGRKKERKRLLDVLARDEAQLVAVYGRRRIGKTFLVRETFGDGFYFQHAGLAHGTLKEQLAAFHDSLVRSGAKDVPELKNWRQAFNALERFIVAGGSRRRKIISFSSMKCRGWIRRNQSSSCGLRHSGMAGVPPGRTL